MVVLRYIIAFLLLIPSVAFGGELVIPDARRIDWTSAGVSGGIPTVTDYCTTDACNTLYSGGENVTTANINAAITSASGGASPILVRIPAGSFTVDAGILLQTSNVVLSGASITATELTFTGATTLVKMGKDSVYSSIFPPVTITANISKGATSFTTNTTTYLGAGELVLLQGDNPAWAWNAWDDEVSTGTKTMSQIVKIESIDGTTVNFTPAAVGDFTNPTYSVFVSTVYDSYKVHHTGLQDMKIVAPESYTNNNITINVPTDSWIKNVHLDGIGAAGFYFENGYNFTIQRCKVDGASSWSDGYAVQIVGNTSGVLIEDNIFADVGYAASLNALSGSVVAYNYCYKLGSTTWNQTAAMVTHGSNPWYNLYEGNVLNGILDADGYHSGSSNVTYFRNSITGVSGKTHDKAYCWRLPVRMNRYSRYQNVIGNIIGNSSWDADTYEESGAESYCDTNAIYALGYPNAGGNAYNVGDGEHGDYPAGGGKAYLQIGTASAKVATTNTYYAFDTSARYWLAATEITLSGDSIPTGEKGAFAFDVGTNGTIDVIPATNNATGLSAGELVLRTIGTGYTFYTRQSGCTGIPYPESNHWRMGQIIVQNDSGSDFVPGTTALNASGITTTYYSYYNFVGGLDADVKATLLRHKNYDYYTDSVTICNDANNTEGCQSATNVAVEDTIPDSLFLSQKPSWWCAETTWPPVNPDTATYSKIPAQRRYEGLSCNGGTAIGSGGSIGLGAGGTITLQ